MSREKKLEHHEEERYVASIKNQPHMSLLSTTLIFPKKDTLTLHNIHRCLGIIRKLLVGSSSGFHYDIQILFFIKHFINKY